MTTTPRDPYTPPAPVEAPVEELIAAWTAANDRARRAYRLQPNACTSRRWKERWS